MPVIPACLSPVFGYSFEVVLGKFPDCFVGPVSTSVGLMVMNVA
jgi:hypothetical protein